MQQRISRAARESVGELTGRVVGGLLGLVEGAVWGAVLWALVGGYEAFMNRLDLGGGLSAAANLGAWGTIWGAALWMAAGIVDTTRGRGAFTRAGVRGGALMGLVINGIVGALVWGVILTASAILREGSPLSTGLLTDKLVQGSIAGARLGAPLGALWGLAVRVIDRIEIRALPGMVWSLLAAALISALASVVLEVDALTAHIIWGIAAVVVFTLWAAVRTRTA